MLMTKCKSRPTSNLWMIFLTGLGLSSCGSIDSVGEVEKVVAPLSQVTSLSAGLEHTCAVSRGAVFCWGENNYGALGLGSTLQSSVGIRASFRDLGASVTQVAAGQNFSCAVRGGEAWCWGENRFGSLGNGSTTSAREPSRVTGLNGQVNQVAAGFQHACALTSSGVYCWGRNHRGQSGNGTTTKSSSAILVSGLPGIPSRIDAAGDSSCALMGGGALYCWGDNFKGELGDGQASGGQSASPVLVTGFGTGVTDFSMGSDHVCAISAGQLSCWGDNEFGQLGDGSQTRRNVPTPISGQSWVGVAAGGLHSCAWQNSGALFCWGKNAQGQLGTGSSTDAFSPAEVSGLPRAVTAVALGKGLTSGHSCALLSDQTLYCWGAGQLGQLGDNSRVERSLVPVQVQGTHPKNPRAPRAPLGWL